MIIINHESFVRLLNHRENIYLAYFNNEMTKVILFDWNRSNFRRNALFLTFNKLKK
jgi:hypothetical protein